MNNILQEGEIVPEATLSVFSTTGSARRAIRYSFVTFFVAVAMNLLAAWFSG